MRMFLSLELSTGSRNSENNTTYLLNNLGDNGGFMAFTNMKIKSQE